MSIYIRLTILTLMLWSSVLFSQVSFMISGSKNLEEINYTGRIYIVFSKDSEVEPRSQFTHHYWLNPPSILYKDVRDWNIHSKSEMDEDNSIFFNGLAQDDFKNMPEGDYYVQLILRNSLDYFIPGSGEGDYYSPIKKVNINHGENQKIALVLDQAVPAKTFEETSRVKSFNFKSDLLTKFHGRDIFMEASVILPKDYDKSKKYPVLYHHLGFQSTHLDFESVIERYSSESKYFDEILHIIPNPMFYYGHTVFADSDNNGPWATAFVKEFIPAVEEAFSGAQDAKHRYITGKSSGGWSSLWVQINFPNDFNGTWSHAPDPVDFRDFQLVNLYEESSNFYLNFNNEERLVGRWPLVGGDLYTLGMKQFVAMEKASGFGGQIGSFEAVFSERDPITGNPKEVFDRETGKIDLNVFENWKKYDVSLYLKENWNSIGYLIEDKIHVYAGEKENFFLEGSVRLLKKDFSDTNMEILIIPYMEHKWYTYSFKYMFLEILTNWKSRD